jgi:hypothetical protein
MKHGVLGSSASLETSRLHQASSGPAALGPAFAPVKPSHMGQPWKEKQLLQSPKKARVSCSNCKNDVHMTKDCPLQHYYRNCNVEMPSLKHPRPSAILCAPRSGDDILSGFNFSSLYSNIMLLKPPLLLCQYILVVRFPSCRSLSKRKLLKLFRWLLHGNGRL